MGLFNFNKKKFLSKLSIDQQDEILITLILMKQMIDADGVEKPKEKEYYKKYLINCGISSKEELESILDRAANLTTDQYDLIVNDFDEFQKLSILQELYGIICSDNEINQDELDLLFRISRDMGVDDDIIVDMLGAKKDLFEKFNESKDNSESKNVSNKFCSECGNQFESDQKFCPICGNKRNIDELDKGELKDKVETDQENKQKIIEEAKVIIGKLKNNELEIRVNQGEGLLCQFQFNEEFKSYAETDEFKEHSKSYGETEAFDYSYDNDIERYVSNPELYSGLKTFSGWLELWQVFKVPNDAFIEHINHFIQSVKEDCEYYGQYKSVEDYLEEAVEWDGEYDSLPYSEHTLGFNGPKLKECFIGFLEEENKGCEVKIEFFDITNKKISEDFNEDTVYIKSNKELRLILSGIDKDEINSFSVDILYDKWTFFEEINYKGTFKGFDFILKGGSAIKWSKHKGCYKDDINTFLNDINSKEISELDFQILNYDCEDSDEDYDYNFFEKIIWNKNTPREIIKDIEENYSDNEFEKLRDEVELEKDYLDIELFQDKGLINQLSISISYKNNKVKYLSWIKEESHSNIIDKEKIGERFLDFQDVRKLIAQLKENKIPIKFRSIWENYFYYQLKDESQKGFASESDHWDILNKYLDTFGIKKDYDKEKQLHSNYIAYIEEKEIDYDQFLEESAIEDYIDACEKQDKDEYKGWVQLDFSYDDYLSWTVEEDFFNDPAAPGWLNSNKRDLIAPINQANEEIKTEFSLDYNFFDNVIDFNFSEVNFTSQDHLYVFDDKLLINNYPRNEKDLIQELGRIHESLVPNEYQKKAFDLWRNFFLLKYNENEEKDGWEIGQEANNKMFDKYEVDYVNFFINHIDDGDTNSLGVRFPFKYLENGKPALIYNFPFKYDQITAHSSGSFYQLDKAWGSLNDVCKSLSELEVIDFNKLSQKEKIQLFRPNRDDY